MSPARSRSRSFPSTSAAALLPLLLLLLLVVGACSRAPVPVAGGPSESVATSSSSPPSRPRGGAESSEPTPTPPATRRDPATPSTTASPATTGTAAVTDGDVPVTIRGGYETDPRDHGRPVVLVASILGVPPDVFRQAFSAVSPAPAGQEPDPAQVNRNKAALLNVLAPYGVTNESLDRASNHYRYNASAGEHWPARPAAAVAHVQGGKVTGFTVTDPGSGYSSTPTITVAVGGTTVQATATLSYTSSFASNGSITEISVE